MDIHKGDIVQLKSGGPLMTVSGYVFNRPTICGGGFYCIWFNKDGELRGSEFSEDVLCVPKKKTGGKKIKK